MNDAQVMRVLDEMMDRMFGQFEMEEREIEQEMAKKYCNELMMQSGNGYEDVPQGAVVFNRENENA